MTLRVHALWQNKWVLGYLLSLGVIQVAMWGYVLTNSERKTLNLLRSEIGARLIGACGFFFLAVAYPSIDGIFHGAWLWVAVWLDLGIDRLVLAGRMYPYGEGEFW